MTLADVASLTGLWPATILTFIRTEVLPPVAGDRPLADREYSSAHVAAARFVARMQAEHQLGLPTLAEVLIRTQYDLKASERDLMARVAHESSVGVGPGSIRTIARAAGTEPAVAECLAAAGLIPKQGPYRPDHVDVVRCAAALTSTGMELFLVERVGQLAAATADLERAHPRSAGTSETAGQQTADVESLLSAARLAGTSSLMANLAAASASSSDLAAVAVHVPSPMFVARFGLNTSLDSMVGDGERVLDPSVIYLDASPVRAYGRLLLGVGRVADARAWLERGLEHPAVARDGSVWATVALARGLAHDHKEAASAIDRALVAAPDSARVEAFRAAVVAMAAAGTGELLRASALITEALLAAEQSRTRRAADLLESLEAKVSTGRLCSLLPAGLGTRAMGQAELREVCEQTAPDGPAIDGLAIAGTRELMHLNAVYYLGVALHIDGQFDEATEWLKRVIELDPGSGFGRDAYQRLLQAGTVAERPNEPT